MQCKRQSLNVPLESPRRYKACRRRQRNKQKCLMVNTTSQKPMKLIRLSCNVRINSIACIERLEITIGGAFGGMLGKLLQVYGQDTVQKDISPNSLLGNMQYFQVDDRYDILICYSLGDSLPTPCRKFKEFPSLRAASFSALWGRSHGHCRRSWAVKWLHVCGGYPLVPALQRARA